MRRAIFILVTGLLSVGISGCEEPHFSEGKKFVSGTVSAEMLNIGREKYMLNCYACHGENGDGKGPAAAFLRPPPRDFRQGLYKFGAVGAGELPHTADLVRLVKRGLSGTAMLPWDVPDVELTAIIEYIKTFSEGPEDDDFFSNRWQDPDEELGERIVATEDPFKGDVAAGVAFGEKSYHVTARCSLCHPSYASKDKVYAFTKELTGTAPAKFDANMYRSRLRDSEYGVKILPIDFLYHPIKTVKATDSAADAVKELYVTIAAGVGGTAMPKWKGALSEKDLWGLAYYVQSLAKLRGTKDGLALRNTLDSQPEFVAPEESGDEAADTKEQG